jgi:hypothetical protein
MCGSSRFPGESVNMEIHIITLKYCTECPILDDYVIMGVYPLSNYLSQKQAKFQAWWHSGINTKRDMNGQCYPWKIAYTNLL